MVRAWIRNKRSRIILHWLYEIFFFVCLINSYLGFNIGTVSIAEAIISDTAIKPCRLKMRINDVKYLEKDGVQCLKKATFTYYFELK